MAKKLKKNDVVYIEWFDIQSSDGTWTDQDINIILAKSIGFVHKLDKKQIVIKAHYLEDKTPSHITAIPLGCIKKLQKLKIV